MKTSLIIAALALTATPALAQSVEASQTVNVTGNVASMCSLGAPTSASVPLGQMAQTAGANAGRITTIANQTVTLPGSFCNYANTRVSVQATALTATATTAPANFARAVNYTATVSNWAATSSSATTNAAADGSTPTVTTSGAVQSTPRQADLSLVLSNFTVPANALMVAGGYSGAVVVTLGPEAAPQQQ